MSVLEARVLVVRVLEVRARVRKLGFRLGFFSVRK